MALKTVKRYQLELVEKMRRYTFAPDGDRVTVERWERFKLEWRVVMSRREARRRWRWLVDRCGYQEW